MEYDLGASTFAITTKELGHTPGAKGAIVAFEVSDLDAFGHNMKERAVSFVTEAFDRPVCRMAVVENQDHNHITIQKRHRSVLGEKSTTRHTRLMPLEARLESCRALFSTTIH